LISFLDVLVQRKSSDAGDIKQWKATISKFAELNKSIKDNPYDLDRPIAKEAIIALQTKLVICCICFGIFFRKSYYLLSGRFFALGSLVSTFDLRSSCH
jgi:hypothetical protein